MKIVIDIPDKVKKTFDNASNEDINNSYYDYNSLIGRAIQNGTPLPKGHGRLKDENEVIKAIEDRVAFLKENDACFMRLRKDIDILGCIPKIRTEVPTIIEADKGEEE